MSAQGWWGEMSAQGGYLSRGCLPMRCLPRGGGVDVCPGVVGWMSAQGGYLPRGCLPRGCPPRGVSA